MQGLAAKERFLAIYANVPLGVRREIVAIVDDRPVSWDVAYIEVEQGTPQGDLILEKLEKLQII